MPVKLVCERFIQKGLREVKYLTTSSSLPEKEGFLAVGLTVCPVQHLIAYYVLGRFNVIPEFNAVELGDSAAPQLRVNDVLLWPRTAMEISH